MKTISIKKQAGWTALLFAILIIRFTTGFAQSNTQSELPTSSIEKDINSDMQQFDSFFNTPTNPSPYQINVPRPYGYPILPPPRVNPVPNPDPLHPGIPIDTVATNNGEGRMATASNTQLINENQNVLQPNNLEIYPNPGNGIFTMNFHSNMKGDLQVQITDITGKELFSGKLYDADGNYTNAFDLSNKARGIYMLTIEQNDERLTKKIIIN